MQHSLALLIFTLGLWVLERLLFRRQIAVNQIVSFTLCDSVLGANRFYQLETFWGSWDARRLGSELSAGCRSSIINTVAFTSRRFQNSLLGLVVDRIPIGLGDFLKGSISLQSF